MASIHRKKGSANWHCAFYYPDGRRAMRSTGTADKATALRICLEYEAAAKQGREGRLTASRVRNVLSDVLAHVDGEKLPSMSVKDYLKSWLIRKQEEVGERSYHAYELAADRLQRSLGNKAAHNLDSVTPADAIAFRGELSSILSAASVNKYLKILRGAWNDAITEGLTRDNPFKVTKLVREPAKAGRRAFTLEELGKILAVCDTEWRGLVLFGLYTGQRLNDLVSLTWRNVDISRAEITLTTGKTGRSMVIPMHPVLMDYCHGIAGDDADGDLFTELAKLEQSTVSRQFADLLAAAGLAKKQAHRTTTGKGRSYRRATGGLSFHCLRHTATSLLKNAGISDVVAREIIGHDSVEISRQYTHIERRTLADAIDKLPSIPLPQLP